MSSRLRISRFSIGERIVNEDGIPTSRFLSFINNTFANVVSFVNDQADLLAAIQAASDAAAAAQDAADAAAATASAAVKENKLANSYVTPGNLLSATINGSNATITVAAHNRVYGDGSTVPVQGGSLNGLAPATLYYVIYLDPELAGGAVIYSVTTDYLAAGQGNGRHTVGSITTPATGATDPTTGGGTRPPGTWGGGGGGGGGGNGNPIP